MKFKPEDAQHSLLHFGLELGDLRGSGAAAIHNRQTVFARDPNAAFGVALVKSGPLEEPRGRDFDLAVGSRIARRGLRARGGKRCNSRVFGRRNDWILEERAGAAAVIVVWHKQHRLAGANGTDRFTGLRERGGRSLGREIILEVGVL